jgi:type IV pilus assembly protein PilA
MQAEYHASQIHTVLKEFREPESALVLTSVTRQRQRPVAGSDWDPNMLKALVCFTLVMVWASGSWAQESSTPPQTARQALMEMLFSKTKGTFWKHLPEATRTALEKSGEVAAFHQYSAMMTEVQTQTQNVRTFETGPLMLSGQDPKTGNKYEMIVEHDALRGDHDDIEVSFRTYKDGQPQRISFMPNVNFSMKKESEIWTLNEISITIHLPLADPDMLKAITDQMHWKPDLHTQPVLGGPSTDAARPVLTAGTAANSDTQVITAMHTIVSAENTYASTYPNVGYTCTLSSLDGFGTSEPGPNQAMLISSSLAGGRKYGYVFTLSGCTGAPAGKFLLTAVPNESGWGRKVFCADGSGVIRSSDEANAASCIATGNTVQQNK